MTGRVRGIVKWFDASKGYGYIQWDGGEDVFVHYTAITDKGLKMLAPGQEVEFTLLETVRGLEAAEVIKV